MSRYSSPSFSPPPPPIQLSGFIITETLKAMLFEVHMVGDRSIEREDLRKQIWLPISQITKSLKQSHLPAGDKDIIHVKEWIWRSKLEDSWGGKDPSLATVDEVSLDQAFNDIDPDEYDDYVDLEEGPPF